MVFAIALPAILLNTPNRLKNNDFSHKTSRAGLHPCTGWFFYWMQKMATPQENIEALEKALSHGKLTVSVDGQSITYRSIADILTAIRYWQNKTRSSKQAFTIAKFRDSDV